MTGVQGIPSYVKVLACYMILAGSGSFDSVDESGRIASETLRKYFYKFIVHVKELYGDIFLNRQPNADEMEAIQEGYRKKRICWMLGGGGLL